LVSARTLEFLDVAAIVIVCGLSGVAFYQGLGIEVWRSDSLYYVDARDYAHKVTREGRWLIYLLFDALKALPGQLLWLLGHVAGAGFAYRVARVHGLDSAMAFLFAALAAQIPSIWGQSFWPAATFPALVLTLLASLLCSRLPMAIFYGLFGVLFFGVNQQYYFLLPVLHLPWVLASLEGSLRATLRLLLYWVLGFFGGCLVSLSVVFLASGEVGFPIDAWRQPHYVNDFRSLLDNVASRGGLLAEHLGVLLDLAPAGLALLVAAALSVLGRSGSNVLARLVILSAVGLAIYAVTIPIGVRVDFRSVTPLFLAILAFCFLDSPSRAHRVFYPVGVLLVFVPFWGVNLDNVLWFRGVNDAYRAELIRVTPQPPASYNGLVIVGGDARSLQARIEDSIGRRPRYIVPHLSTEGRYETRWRPAALAAGFRFVRHCAGISCPPRPDSCLAESDAYCIEGVTEQRHVLLRFVTP
jgi:hypothetical protein